MTKKTFTIFLFIAAFLFALSNCFAAREYNLEKKEKRMIKEIIAMSQKFKLKNNKIWPGFNPLARPIVISMENGQSIFFGKIAPKGYSKIKGYEYPVYRSNGEAEKGISASFLDSYKIGGINAFFCRMKNSESVENTAMLLVHERFHEFQDKKFANMIRDSKRSKDNDKESLIRALPERIFLARALLSSRNSLSDIRKFIVLRERRRSRVSKSIIEEENRQERIEGTATYVEYKAIGNDNRFIVSEAALRVIDQLMSPLENYITSSIGRHYGNGAAQALLMDKLNIPWKNRVEKGESIFSVFREYFPIKDKKKLLAQADAFIGDISNIAEKKSMTETSENNEKIRKYKEYKGWILSLKGLAFSGMTRNGGKIIHMKNGLLYSDIYLYERYVNKVNFSAVNTSIADENGVLKVLLGKKPKFRIEINGKKMDEIPAEPVKFKELCFESQNLVLDIKRAGTIQLKGKNIRVDARLLPPKAFKDDKW